MSVLREKSYAFSVRVVRLHRFLCEGKHEYLISKQLLRAGTSIGANLAEADYAISRSDFQAKLYIALKETSETLYWLQLLYDTDYLTLRQFQSMYSDCEELRKMLSASTKTIRESPKQKAPHS